MRALARLATARALRTTPARASTSRGGAAARRWTRATRASVRAAGTPIGSGEAGTRARDDDADDEDDADDDERGFARALEEDARGSRGASPSFFAARVPSRRALLNRACAARAWKCLRLLLGGPWVSADKMEERNDARHESAQNNFFSCASTEAI